MNHHNPITPRERLDFGLEGDIPKYWFGGHPFKTRFFDAMSTIFPEGERFFISCVRDFRDQVSDPVLREEIKHFIRQEGQHGIVHSQYNERLKAQGIDVDMLEGYQSAFIGWMRKHLPKKHTLATTAAAEHMTSIMAHSFFARKDVMGAADPRMRAMYAWHAMEEIEHKAVAFDVMQKIAKVWYPRRIVTMIEVTLGFTINAMLTTRYMLKVDGFSRWQRTKLWAQGIWWLYKPGTGLFMSMFSMYMHYYKPGFHPWQHGQMDSYQLWLDTFNKTGDPIVAGEVLHAAAA